MIRAILDGRKTQTRRVFTTDTNMSCEELTARCKCKHGQPGDRLWVRETWYDDFQRQAGEAHELNIDRFDDGRVEGIEYRASHDCAAFEAGCPCNPDGDGKRSEWRPSIHMPRWASRITLELTEVRVERLQSISEDDARAEGVVVAPCRCCAERGGCTPGPSGPCCPCCLNTGEESYREGFMGLWDAINGKRPGCTWNDNPWVWVLAFRRIEQ